MAETSSGLTPEQTNALFDILTHRETYAEIEDFKVPGAIHKYGPPFQDDKSTSTSPVLQLLLSKFVLKLPGLRDVSPRFWKVQVEDLIQELSQAELRRNPRRSAPGSHAKGGCPPSLVRQSDRKVNFVDNLVGRFLTTNYAASPGLYLTQYF